MKRNPVKTEREAVVILATTIAEYIDNDYPLEYLTGEEGDGHGGTSPDPYFKGRIEDALRKLGYTGAADKLARTEPTARR